VLFIIIIVLHKVETAPGQHWIAGKN